MVAWLHLSDWHQEDKDDNARALVAENLILDVENRDRIDPALVKIDFVVFSGDLSNSGQYDEYIRAYDTLLRRLLKACGDLGPDGLFIVPGNHDVDIAACDSVDTKELKKLWKAHEPADNIAQVNRMISDDILRHSLLAKFNQYKTFLCDHMRRKFDPSSDPRYFYTETFDTSDSKVSIMCLNSAWLSGHRRDHSKSIYDHGYLYLTDSQIADAKQGTECSDLVLAVMHHPLSWLQEYDEGRSRESLSGCCHFILHGHHHAPGVQIVQSNDGEILLIPAGASWESRMPGDPRHVPSYNFVHVDPKTRLGAVHFRKWLENRRFTPDEDVWERGRFPFVLPLQQMQGLGLKDLRERRTLFHELQGVAVPYLTKKCYERVEMTITHQVVDSADVGAHSYRGQLVRQDVRCTLELGTGEERTFSITIPLDSGAVRILGSGRRAFRWNDCRINGEKVTASSKSIRSDAAGLKAGLGWSSVTVAYDYTTYYLTSDHFYYELDRFAKQLDITLDRSCRLKYAWRPVGGFRPNLDPNETNLTTTTTVFPFQGVVISWDQK